MSFSVIPIDLQSFFIYYENTSYFSVTCQDFLNFINYCLSYTKFFVAWHYKRQFASYIRAKIKTKVRKFKFHQNIIHHLMISYIICKVWMSGIYIKYGNAALDYFRDTEKNPLVFWILLTKQKKNIRILF